MRSLLKYYFFVAVAFACSNFFFACNIFHHTKTKAATKNLNTDNFTVEVQPYNLKNPLPGLQSCAWAISGNKLLLIGGRAEGYHGLPQSDTVFKTSKANKSIWVIDLSNFSYTSVALNPNDSSLLQLFASDFEYCQDNDTLYIVGGFGIQHTNDIQSNRTFDRMIAIQVSVMIQQVQLQNNGNIQQAITDGASSPFLQVAGGAMFKKDGIFFLMFGQNYQGVYQPTINGSYTNAIRRFRLANSQLIDTSSYTDTILHRRDITVAPVVQKNKLLYAAFGGVFTSNDNGFLNPILINTNGGNISVQQDTLVQLTSQYNCANAVIFDKQNNICTNVLLGGIGRYEYDTTSKKWLDGDHHAKLPFVQSITQMSYQNGALHQHVQLPPQQPEMPGFIGADAIFIPLPGIASKGIINYNELIKGKNLIGYMFGGIQSSLPTSSIIYPTTVNNILYAVYLNKN